MINAPILCQLVLAKDALYGRRFERAIDDLNKGLREKKIWNVEINDAKFALSNGIDRALDVICERSRANRGTNFRYEEWMNDFSSYCSFNQAAGRIKRLTKTAQTNAVVADYIKALKEVDAIWQAIKTLKPYIQKGRRPNENKTEAQIALELKNTGMCAICNRRQKLKNDKIVHHGYKMSDYNHSGYRIGKCFGTKYLCYELSNEANVAYAPVLARQLKDYQAQLKHLKSGTIETLVVFREKYVDGRLQNVSNVLTKGTPEFDRELGSEIYQKECFLRYTKSDIKANDAKISNWKLQPLKYGRK
jgi:hypothetical protein